MTLQVENVPIYRNGKTVSAKRLTISSLLPCNAEKAWREAKTSKLFLTVIKSMLTFKPIGQDGFPALWPKGGTIKGKSYLWGFIPFGGTRTIYIEKIDDSTRELQSREYDKIINTWDHLIKINSIDENSCKYTDQVIIEAGALTGYVLLFAKMFYKHRQRNWQGVAECIAK